MVVKKADVMISLPRLNIQKLEIQLVGDTPLLVNAWSKKAKQAMRDKQTKKATTKREAKDPQRDFEESMYRLPNGGYGFPSLAFKNAAVTAVTSVSGVTKIAARQAFYVEDEFVEIHGGKAKMREDMVRIGQGVADLRYRAEFWPWQALITVSYNADMLSPEQIVNLFNTAGFAVGVGDWRTERNGNMGRFHVATGAESIKAAKARKKAAPKTQIVRRVSKAKKAA